MGSWQIGGRKVSLFPRSIQESKDIKVSTSDYTYWDFLFATEYLLATQNQLLTHRWCPDPASRIDGFFLYQYFVQSSEITGHLAASFGVGVSLKAWRNCGRSLVTILISGPWTWDLYGFRDS